MTGLTEESNGRIGVIGYWFATNYGGVASYYSLYKAIEELGYSPFLVENPYFKTDREGDDVFSRNFFKNEGINIAPGLDMNELNRLNEMTDTFVLGSDQVFTYSSIRAYGKLFLMQFADQAKKRIAYSASCGGDQLNIDDGTLSFMKNELQKFLAVSVREYSATEIIKNKLDLNAVVLTDPIFFTGAEEYKRLGTKAGYADNQGYFLSYILDPTDDKRKCIERITEYLGFPPKIVLDGRKFTHQSNLKKMDMGKATLPELDFYQWLGAYGGASFVFTDSYHGAAMSLILNIPCIIYVNEGRGLPRFETLGEMFGVKSRLISGSSELTERLLQGKMDFIKINKKIIEESNKGKDWLCRMLTKNEPKKSIDVRMDLKRKCIGCGTCSNVCPVNAITMLENADGFLNPVVNLEQCIDCGLCSKKCVVLHQKYENAEDPECYAVCADDKIRKDSSSGGCFTVFSDYILRKNGLICGAIFDEQFHVRHILSSDPAIVQKMRGSKYYQSDLGDVFKQIKQRLEEGKYVLFTGLPCQTAGLRSYLGKDYPTLYMVDLLCHGVSSYKVFEKYRRDIHEGKTLQSLGFRDKTPWGWSAGVHMVFSDGTIYHGRDSQDLYFQSYLSGLSKNKGCGSCLFNRLPRQGDLSIGDFWKIWEFDTGLNDTKGTSVILVNNRKGVDLLNKVLMNFPVRRKVPISWAVAGNGVITRGDREHSNRGLFFEHLDTAGFAELVYRYSNRNPYNFPDALPENMRGYYYLAEIIKENKGDRSVVFWGDNPIFRSFLMTYYGVSVEFSFAQGKEEHKGGETLTFSEIAGKSGDYYIVVFGRMYSKEDAGKFQECGFDYIKDFAYRDIEPIVLKNFDLSKGYRDIYGNRIEKSSGVVKRIVFRGFNNNISISRSVFNLKNLVVDLSANSTVAIAKHTNLTQPDTRIETLGKDGTAKVVIGESCIFMDTLFRVYVHRSGCSIQIGDYTTTGEQTGFHANQGKNISIGKDCLIEAHTRFFAGQGHTIMDVKTGKPVNLFNAEDARKNRIVLGDHVWTGFRSYLAEGTEIGEGSIVEAQSTVKGFFPNNCLLSGAPATLCRKDVAWSREMITTEMAKCAGYVRLTTSKIIDI